MSSEFAFITDTYDTFLDVNFCKRSRHVIRDYRQKIMAHVGLKDATTVSFGVTGAARKLYPGRLADRCDAAKLLERSSEHTGCGSANCQAHRGIEVSFDSLSLFSED